MAFHMDNLCEKLNSITGGSKTIFLYTNFQIVYKASRKKCSLAFLELFVCCVSIMNIDSSVFKKDILIKFREGKRI